MPVGDQNHGGVPVTVAVVLRGLDHPLDLGRGEVLAPPQLGYFGQRGATARFFHWHFGLPLILTDRTRPMVASRWPLPQ